MVVVPARALVVEVRLSQRGGIGLARPAILLLAATGGPGASQSAGGLAERHALEGGGIKRTGLHETGGEMRHRAWSLEAWY